MIANKGLPVELEPTEGLFAGRAAAAAAAVTSNAAAAAAAADPGAAEGVAAGETPGPTAAGVEAAEAPTRADALSQLQPQSLPLSLDDAGAVAVTNLSDASTNSAGTGARAGAEGRVVGGTGRVVDANAAWISSNAKAKERSAGKTSDQALGAAGKMRAEVSSGVLPMLQGFVPAPVTDLLAVSDHLI